MTEAQRQADGLIRFVSEGEHLRDVYGFQWGNPDTASTLKQIRDDWLLSNLAHEMTALEIGSGGGRWSRYFIDRVQRAVLVDATPSSETAIRARFPWTGFEFLVSSDGRLKLKDESIDFAFSFDTFVHFDVPLFDQYASELGRVLKHGARLVLHWAKRWPGCQLNEACFRYREDDDVRRVLKAADMSWTREFALNYGHGSILAEFVKGA